MLWVLKSFRRTFATRDLARPAVRATLKVEERVMADIVWCDVRCDVSRGRS